MLANFLVKRLHWIVQPIHATLYRKVSRKGKCDDSQRHADIEFQMTESTKVGKGSAIQTHQMGDTNETHHQESKFAHEVLVGFLFQGHSLWSVKLELKQRPKVLKSVLEALRFEHEGE